MEPLRELYDFRKLTLPEPLFRLGWDPAEVEAALEAVRVRFLTIRETEGPVRAGDIVVFRLPEAGGEEEKRVQINVGRHFYDPAFEDALAGLTLGSEAAMPPRDGGRTGILVQIKRRCLPPLEDGLIARMGIEGAATVADYRELWRRKLLERDKRKKADAIYTMTMNQVVERSVFGDLTEETERQLKRSEAQYRAMAGEYGMTYEELLAQAVPPQYDTPEKRDAYLRSQAEKRARESLAVRRFAEQEGKAFTREDFEKARQDYLDRGMTRDQVEKFLPSFEAFLEGAPFRYFKDAVMAYFDKDFKVVEKA